MLVMTAARRAALSLVSKHVRNITEPYRMYSVALCGWSRIFAFARLLKTWDRPIFTRHLFIATIPLSNDGCHFEEYQNSALSPTIECFEIDINVPDGRTLSSKDEQQAVIDEILAAVRQTLWTLSAFGFPAYIPQSLPILRELTLHYRQSPSLAEQIEKVSKDIKTPFPEVDHIHLLGETANCLSAHFVARAHQIVALRLSRPGFDTAKPIRRLRDDLDYDRLPKSPRHILIEPTPEFHICGNGWNSSYVWRYRNLRKAVLGSSLIETVTLLPMSSYLALTAKEQKEAWRSAISGTQSVWRAGDEGINLAEEMLSSDEDEVSESDPDV